MLDQMNWWIHSGQGFIGSFDLAWSEWSRITDRDPDYPKRTHPIGDWDRIYSNQKEIKYVSAFNFRADVEALPPQLHILFISLPPSHP